MGDKTGIQWTDATWNPVRGCFIVSPGCTNCYAMKQARRMSQPGGPYEGLTSVNLAGRVTWNGVVREVPHLLDQPFRWQKPRMIFVNSMGDLFHDGISDDFIAEVFMVMGMTDRHRYQLLTKRPERMLDLLGDRKFWLKIGGKCEAYAERVEKLKVGELMGFDAWWQEIEEQQAFPNVWLGVSVEDQRRLIERVPLLLETPAKVRWVSAEPLLEVLQFRTHDNAIASYLDGLQWVVVGGESGSGARECRAMWIRDIVRQCREAETAVFVKQLGARWSFDKDTEYGDWVFSNIKHRKGGVMSEWPEDLQVQEYP